MNTNRIAKITLDLQRLAGDLTCAESFEYTDTYNEFVCGLWRTCMLWNKSGELSDHFVSDYNQAAKKTLFGEKLVYLTQLITALFDISLLRFVRLVKLCPNSVLLPHRDYLELKQPLCRIHIPLQTDNQCFSSEENIIYQMKVGEVWFLDATQVHSAASFSEKDRTHLILDFAYVDNIRDLLKIQLEDNPSIPAANLVQRPPLTVEEEESIRSLCKIIDLENFRDILALLIRKYFRKNVSASMVYEWLMVIATQNNNPVLVDKVVRLRDYCLIRR